MQIAGYSTSSKFGRTPLLVLCALIACKEEPPAPDPRLGQTAIKAGPLTVADVDRARGAELVGNLKSSVLGALTQALGQGAPAALEACSVQAPMLTSAMSRDGVRLGRATRKPRNPENEAKGWQADAIAQFERTSGAGKALAGSTFARKLADGRIAYAEPLVIQEVCLTCHGTAIAPDVLAAITAKYPADKATGYKLGELRGVAWAEMPPAGAGTLDVGGAPAPGSAAAPPATGSSAAPTP